MIEFTTDFIQKKNALTGGQKWLQLLEVQLDTSTTAYLVNYPDTVSYAGNNYLPFMFNVSADKSSADGSLPRVNVDVSNFGGLALSIARDYDLTLNNVTLKLVEESMLSQTSTADFFAMKLKILSAGFSNEAARFVLGLGFSFSAQGPLGRWNRIDHPSIAFSFSKYGLL